MSRKIMVKPKEGVTVKDHLGRVIDSDGQLVCDTFVIRRLIRDGDLVRVTRTKAKKDKN